MKAIASHERLKTVGRVGRGIGQIDIKIPQDQHLAILARSMENRASLRPDRSWSEEGGQ